MIEKLFVKSLVIKMRTVINMNSKITYKIVYGHWVKPKLTKIKTLEEEVNLALRQGYSIHGAPFVLVQGNNPLIGQVVTKPEKYS